MLEQARAILVNATRGEQVVDAVILSHPALTESLYITPWHPGFTDTVNNWTFQYVPMRVEKPGTVENLSQEFKVVLQDMNEVAGAYLDQIPIDTEIPVTANFYSYYIDVDDNVSVADGPYSLEIGEFASEPDGIGFSATPQATNVSKTGERGTIARTGGLYRQYT